MWLQEKFNNFVAVEDNEMFSALLRDCEYVTRVQIFALKFYPVAQKMTTMGITFCHTL